VVVPPGHQQYNDNNMMPNTDRFVAKQTGMPGIAEDHQPFMQAK
jgi:hypothetical protein